MSPISNNKSNNQHLSFIKSCGPDSYAPILSRLAHNSRWQEASHMASIMLQHGKFVHASQLAVFVSHRGTNNYWREMLKNFCSATQDGYLQPSTAVACAASMTVTYFESSSDNSNFLEGDEDHRSRQDQNDSTSSANVEKKLPSQIACVGVLYWMVNKQRVYASVQQMMSTSDNKNKIKDAIRGVCSENESLQPERIVRKCFKEIAV